jgi:beta-mannosidase
MPCGPWKPIYLDLYSSRVSDVVVHTALASDLQYADVKVEVDVDGPATQANITLRRDGVAQQSQVVDVQQHVARTIFRVQNPQLWWPFTLGEPSLYEIGVSLYEKIDESSEPRISDEVTKRFGIRKVELVQNALPDQEGKTFFFKINNVPIFAAGSCWIPADSFVSRISAQRYRDWVKLARDSNQVMIRVWGGGIYEHEAFYDACDELGILVWQDFMFACGNYPAHAELRKNVAAEVDQNVRLLRHHPSIVLWCGNNEDYAMPLIRQIEYDASESDPDNILQSNFPARYFYEHMFPAICKDLSPDTPYWPGSPFGGDMVNSEHIGDIHQWHVWHLEMFPYQDYPKLAGRFVSEFGMQALPCLETAKEFFPPGYSLGRVGDFSEDEFVKWHNKMEDGAERMAHYGEPNIDYQTTSLPDYIYCTQLIQSEALSTAYRSWRRLWSGPGKEYCAGALVWQLNDCWPVTSWAIADYYLRPKMAYWAVKRECAAITAGVARAKDGDYTVALDVWAVNMTLADVKVDVSVQAWDVVTGRVILDKKIHNAHVLTKNQSTELGRLELDAHVPADLHLNYRDSGYRDVVFTARLVEAASASSVAGDETSADDVLAQTVNFHEPLREVSFQARSADLKLKIVKHAGSTVVEASTDVPIKGLLVQVKNDADAKWDDNGVDLVPGQVARLKYTGTGLEVGQEDRLQARWLGGEWGVAQIIRTSL